MLEKNNLKIKKLKRNIDNFYKKEGDIQVYGFFDTICGLQISDLEENIAEFLIGNFEKIKRLDNLEAEKLFLKCILNHPFFRQKFCLKENIFNSFNLTCLAIKNQDIISYNIGNGLMSTISSDDISLIFSPQDLQYHTKKCIEYRHFKLSEKISSIFLCSQQVCKLVYNDFFYNDFTLKAKKVLKKQNIDEFIEFLQYYNIKTDYYAGYIMK